MKLAIITKRLLSPLQEFKDAVILIDDADRQANLLATVLWRYVMNVHLHEGVSIPEALARAEKDVSAFFPSF